jgi:hypothetical protein
MKAYVWRFLDYVNGMEATYIVAGAHLWFTNSSRSTRIQRNLKTNLLNSSNYKKSRIGKLLLEG